MNVSDAWEIASKDLRFVSAGMQQIVNEPRVPLWPGIFREVRPNQWEPVSLSEWNSLSNLARVEVVTEQMRQITRSIDSAGFVFSSEGIDTETAGFSAQALQESIHKALCIVYRELKESDALSTISPLAGLLLLRLFFGDVPLADESATGAVALILIYGEKYCGLG